MQLLTASIFLTAVCVAIWPMPDMTLPKIKTAATMETIGVDEHFFSYSHAQTLFDRSTLPPVLIPAITNPIDNPTSEIIRHQLLGITLNKSGAVALISDGAHTFNLKTGDILEGFVVSNIESRRIEFKKGDISAALELPPADNK